MTSDPKTFKIRPFEKSDKPEVIALWNACKLVVPWNDPEKDILAKIKFQPDWFLVGVINGTIISTVMVGYEGHRGWINYLAVSPEFQRKGIGTRMMIEAEHLLKAVGCPKINLQIRTSNTDVILFYESLGYSPDDVVSMGKRLITHS
ncbi:MAG: GNAT family acetyltransferase [Theionarchaea archaeon]|nr:GNAT family acetyltransferase [Theionarchaea archaeon]